VARARQLVAQSHAHRPVSTQFWYLRSSPNADRWAQTVKAQLDAVGFLIKLHPVCGDCYIAMTQHTRGVQMAAIGWNEDYPDASSVLPPLLDGGLFNFGHFRDADVSRRLAAALALPVGAARTRGWARMAADVQRRYAPWAVTADQRPWALTSSRLRNVVWNDSYLGVDLAQLSLAR
jgi:ABC-type oligopeptide transport system substrate-binding subunit